MTATANGTRVNFNDKHYYDSPERDILTPEGCRTLLQVGEKAMTQLHKAGLPYVPASNSYRYVRIQVIEWMTGEAERLSNLRRDSSRTKTDI